MKNNITENVQNIPITEIKPFHDHPFVVKDNEDMKKIVESIDKLGTITPLIARPLPDGGYELISGHRRLEACRKLGLEDIPVIVRDMTDDEAIVAMVDANLQREHISYSEKAFAYKMKLEAIKHQGITSRQVVGKVESADTVSSTESGRTVQRYIRLTYLIPQLLKLVDDERIAFSVGVELSYLDIYEQQDVFEAVELEDKTPSLSQAIQMKKLSQKGILDTDAIYKIISEDKPNQREKISLNYDDIKKFFPKQYTVKDIEQRIKKLVEEDYHKRIRKRERDAR
ncbi:MAG: ParB/RepB/Spo0J family partition protein [Ruminococcus sp.]|nr:ParB/RepB/Spo0J family partition protein [Ruminococcus sp.]